MSSRTIAAWLLALAAWPAEATWGDWLDAFERLAPRVLRTPAYVLRVKITNFESGKSDVGQG